MHISILIIICWGFTTFVVLSTPRPNLAPCYPFLKRNLPLTKFTMSRCHFTAEPSSRSRSGRHRYRSHSNSQKQTCRQIGPVSLLLSVILSEPQQFVICCCSQCMFAISDTGLAIYVPCIACIILSKRGVLRNHLFISVKIHALVHMKNSIAYH